MCDGPSLLKTSSIVEYRPMLVGTVAIYTWYINCTGFLASKNTKQWVCMMKWK